MLPRIYHCLGGDGPDRFDPVTAPDPRVVHGRAPNPSVASLVRDAAPIEPGAWILSRRWQCTIVRKAPTRRATLPADGRNARGDKKQEGEKKEG
jgi:hypothetical protein